jgi:hypothetical protein
MWSISKSEHLSFAVQTLSSINNTGKREEMPLATDPSLVKKNAPRDRKEIQTHLHAPALRFSTSMKNAAQPTGRFQGAAAHS